VTPVRRRALALVLALAALACGRRAPAPSPSPSPAAGPIVPPDASLQPIVRPPGAGLSEASLQRMRRRELYLEGLIAGGADRQKLGTAYGELGKIYQAHGLPDAAAPCYENASRLQPRTFAWPYLAARAYWQRERADEALAAAQRALALEPDDLAALVFVGDLHRARGGLEEARKAYAHALEINPRNASALFGLGEIASLSGDFRLAVRMFEGALQVQPNANRVHYPLSLAYGRLGDSEKARRHLALRGNVDVAMVDPIFDAVLRLNPYTYARRGQDALQAGRLGEALELLRAASQALPADPEVRLHLGAALARTGDLEAALEEYREAVRLQPRNPAGHYNLGTTLLSLGREEEALGPLTRAVELHPDYRQAHFNRAQALRRLNKLPEALSALDETLRLAPTHEGAHVARTRVLARLGRCREAVAGAEKGAAAVPGSAALTGVVGRLLAACTTDASPDPARALRLAQQAFAAEGTAEHAAGVALVYAARGDFKEAARWQGRAIGLHPEGADADAFAARLRDYEAGRFAVEW
jgi:tetratricopeptide (TPR) repeat protein